MLFLLFGSSAAGKTTALEGLRGRSRVSPSMIRHEASENEMRWACWSSWRAGDPRWRVRVVDASARPADVVASLVEWIEEERALLRSGTHPLAGDLYAREM